jgi:hypothetical protein
MTDEDLSGLPSNATSDADTGSLEDHEASFGPNGTGELPDEHEPTPEKPVAADPLPDASARDDQGRFAKTPRHRARSQQANPEDVPRIRDLTAKLRQAEAERDEWKAKHTPPPARDDRAPVGPALPQGPVASEASRPAAPPHAWTPPPTRTKPSEDEIGDKYATYADFSEDLADWKYEQREAAREAKQAQEQQQKTHHERLTAYATKTQEARKVYPDFDAVLASADHILYPDVFRDAILSSDRSADLAYWLASHQDEYRSLAEEARSVNHPSAINLVRKVLESKLPVAAQQRSPANGSGMAVSTGSASRPPVLVAAPRPPNPVRTGPQKIGDDPPEDDDSLESHESYFYKRK